MSPQKRGKLLDNSSKTTYSGIHTFSLFTSTWAHLWILSATINYALCSENEARPGKGELEGTRWYLVPFRSQRQDKASLHLPLDFYLTRPKPPIKGISEFLYLTGKQITEENCPVGVHNISFVLWMKKKRDLADCLEEGDTHMQKMWYESFSNLRSLKLLLSDSWRKACMVSIRSLVQVSLWQKAINTASCTAQQAPTRYWDILLQQRYNLQVRADASGETWVSYKQS